MQASSRLVKYIKGVSCVLPVEFRCKFHPLALSSRQCYRRLTEMDIAESHIHEGLKFLGNLGNLLEKLIGLGYRHLQHVIDTASLVLDRKRILLVTVAAALIADDIDRRQEVHFYHLDTGPFTSLATASCDIEREPSGSESAHFGVRRFGKQGTDIIEHTRKCGRIAPRSPADRALVDFYELVDVFDSDNVRIRQRMHLGIVELVLQYRHQCLVYERGFAAAADSADTDKDTQREVYVNVFQVVARRATDSEHLSVPFSADSRHFDTPLSGKIIQGQ